MTLWAIIIIIAVVIVASALSFVVLYPFQEPEDDFTVGMKDKAPFLILNDDECTGIIIQNSTYHRICIEQNELFEIMNQLKENNALQNFGSGNKK